MRLEVGTCFFLFLSVFPQQWFTLAVNIDSSSKNSFRTSLSAPSWRRQFSQAASPPQRSGCQLCGVPPSSFWVLILQNSSFCCPCPSGGSCSLQSHLCVTSGWTLLHFQFSDTWLAIPFIKFSLLKCLLYFSFMTGPWQIQDQPDFIPFTLCSMWLLVSPVLLSWWSVATGGLLD